MSLPLPIGPVLRGDPFDHRDHVVHLAPERRTTGVEVGPRLPQIPSDLGVGIRASDPPDVAEDGQVAVVGKHVVVGGDGCESGLVPERLVRRQNPLLMLRCQEALRPLPRDLTDGVDEQHLAAAVGRLPRPADDDARLHRRVVEEVWPQTEHAFHEVAFDQAASHRPLLLAEQDAVREQDGAPAGLRVQALENVLEEGVVGTALRWRAEDVAAPRIVEPRVAVPGLDRVRRVGDNHVERHQAVSLDEGRVAQHVADRDPEVLDAVQHEVHARDRCRCADDLLSVEAERRDVGRTLRGAFRAIETANPERLVGVFGNAAWTDKAQMPDATLKNLIEHFSKHTLSLAAVPEDELGNAYEYLIKQFADDSGHTAQEFYTNRTLVHLMTQVLRPQPGERIYDPTAGTGGMLISALAEVRRNGGDVRTLGLYGQEIIGTTASIARMNLVLHGVEDFRIAVGNVLSDPAFIERDRLMTFDVVVANPPYSIKTWNRDAWLDDPWGRNILGTPPQGRADYAFFQHLLKSLDPQTGRCAILFPHGVLFRQEEAAMRSALIERDLVDCVLGLGPSLFYNSPMEACVVVCRTRKPPERRGKVLFIDAVHQIARERAQSFLTPEHQKRILTVYEAFRDEPGFAAVASNDDVLANDGNLSILRYVRRIGDADTDTQTGGNLREAWTDFDAGSAAFWREIDDAVAMVERIVRESRPGG